MHLAISPYHLTSRELPAIGSLLLADRVMTLIPSPHRHGSLDDLRRAAHTVPEYYRFMDSWSWSIPLWNEGLIAAPAGELASEPVRHALAAVRSSDRYAALRGFMREGLFSSEEHFLEWVARDVLKGGPDPGICLPLCAALDRFALTNGLVVARAAPTSVAQKAEASLGTRAGAVVVPMLIQAHAERIMRARSLLACELGELAGALCESLCGEGVDGDRLVVAARRYTDAFARHTEAITEPEADEVRTIVGTVAITAMHLPADAVLRSSAAAARTVASRSRVPVSAVPGDSCAPMLRDPFADRSVATLIFRSLDA